MLKQNESAEAACDIGKWVRKFGTWNSKRTKATSTIFSIPNNLLCNSSPEKTIPLQAEKGFITPITSSEEKGRTCRACCLTFVEQIDQLQHFKSELHRINLKRNLVGLTPLVEINGEDVDKIDGEAKTAKAGAADASDDSSSDEEDAADQIYYTEDCFDAEMNDDQQGSTSQKKEYATEEGIARKLSSSHDGPQYLFSPRKSVHWDFSTSVGVLHDNGGVNVYEVEPWTLLSNAVSRIQDKSGSMWCVLVLRSGRFAGAVFDGHSILVHKVLRRYTVRAKAGGSQSSHDGQGKNAKSVGAMLRRYGEQALTEDVRAILKDWNAHLQSCGLIFISCPKTMRSVLFEEGLKDKDTPLKRTDPRVRLVPFMVKKPTFEEVKSIHSRLSTVTFQPRGTVDDDAPPLPALPSGSSVENSIRKEGKSLVSVPILPFNRSSRDLFAACLSGDASSVAAALQDITNNTLNGCSITDEIAILEENHSSDSSSGSGSGRGSGRRQSDSNHDDDSGSGDIHHSTVSPSKHLPGIQEEEVEGEGEGEGEDTRGDAGAEGEVDREEIVLDLKGILDLPESLESLSTCLHLAAEKGFAGAVQLLLSAGADPTRLDARGRPPYFLAKNKDVRDAFRRARATSEDLFAWDAAGVPAALTDEMEKAQRDKEKEKKKKSKAKKKERDEKEVQGAAQAQVALLEQRAVAVREGKNRQLMAGVCAQCNGSLFGVKALDVFDRRCCSSACVLLLRRKLAAEAAELRFAVKTS